MLILHFGATARVAKKEALSPGVPKMRVMPPLEMADDGAKRCALSALGAAGKAVNLER